MPDIDDAWIDSFYASVGGKVRLARVAADVSQELLAQRVGLTRSSIANLEAGRQRVALHLFFLIADALNKGVCELLPSEGSRPHNQPNLVNIDNKLVDSPETMRNFVHGAIARRDAATEDPEV